MHGITSGSQGVPTFASDVKSRHTSGTLSPHETLPLCAETLFLSRYLQLFQAPLKKRAPCGPLCQIPIPCSFLTNALHSLDGSSSTCMHPSCFCKGLGRRSEAEKTDFNFSFLFPPPLERRNKSPEVCYINLFGTHQKGKSTTVNVQKYRILGQDLLS